MNPKIKYNSKIRQYIVSWTESTRDKDYRKQLFFFKEEDAKKKYNEIKELV